MNSFTTMTLSNGDTQRVDFGFRNDDNTQDIGRYRNLLLDCGVNGNVLVTYAVSFELLGDDTYVCSFRRESGNAPAAIAKAMRGMADGHASYLAEQKRREAMGWQS